MEAELGCQMWLNAVNPVNKAALLAWVRETGIGLVQVNGQRKYGGPPPGWIGSLPPPGSEVFIGKLPQDIYEDRLIPLFQSVGKLYEFRLMMTFSGLNRGFAYAKYTNRRSALAAIRALNNFELQKDCHIIVCRSTEKCELSVDGLPCSLGQEELKRVLQEVTTGLLELSLHPSPSSKHECFAVAKYNSHRAAAMAKKALVEDNAHLCGQQLAIDWLKPDMKQKLAKATATRDNGKSSRHALSSPGQQPAPSESAQQLKPPLTTVDILHAFCQRMQLGSPVFLTNIVALSPNGWLRFWYQVVIPGYPVAYSGYIWVIPDKQGFPEQHERAKDAVAQRILKSLAEPRKV
ncbi:dead end protein homolog 1 isoform X2 [Rhinatrema bivittatum]|uniref:dead end protein homolog 1 isoform X2 n=1 Tax=Rhinatrema bivittatum TaxID=194408 RepID=UPI00112CB5C0|nr:dead end protein homolog 1 isoform X2 [Rhinatrema bivittatum]